jgi:esterase/lipase superfamily enzyme
MNRVYFKWHSGRLEREVELLAFGHAGAPALVFPASDGRFYKLQDNGMIAPLASSGRRGVGKLAVEGTR